MRNEAFDYAGKIVLHEEDPPLSHEGHTDKDSPETGIDSRRGNFLLVKILERQLHSHFL